MTLSLKCPTSCLDSPSLSEPRLNYHLMPPALQGLCSPLKSCYPCVLPGSLHVTVPPMQAALPSKLSQHRHSEHVLHIPSRVKGVRKWHVFAQTQSTPLNISRVTAIYKYLLQGPIDQNQLGGLNPPDPDLSAGREGGRFTPRHLDEKYVKACL